MSQFLLNRMENICRDLKKQSVTSRMALEALEYVPSGYKSGNEPPENGWKPFENGMRFRGRDSHDWIRAEFTTPEGSESCEYRLTVNTGREGNVDALNPQGILYLNGSIAQGTDINHTEAALCASTKYEMYFYLYVGMIDAEIPISFSVTETDTRIEQLYYDIKTLLEACRCLEACSDEYTQTVYALELVANTLDFRLIYGDDYYRSIEKASELLHRGFYDKICRPGASTVHCIGHTHIDVAWQWTYAQTREKVQRSFATALALMDKYPEYIFMSSQPQLFEYLKEEAPQLYARVKERVNEGRFEVEGGMWLEADCNLISGESMVRQLMLGKRFIKSEFGTDSRILWLPDVFGYSAAMPQILKKSGIDDFVTSKISWNDTNTMPYDTFVWQGIDGSEILSHFLTAQWMPKDRSTPRYTSYVGKTAPQMILGTRRRYSQKEFNSHVAVTFGFGDGGGGPTSEMLEYQRRTARGIPGIPATKMSTATEWIAESKKSFFENAQRLRRMPKWVGELYLELHRGTYTSIAKNKRNNRRSEMLLAKAEQLCSAARYLLCAEYPRDSINSYWKSVLLNQFHDVLPGSSIHEVYQDTDRIYAGVLKGAQEIGEKCISDIAANVAPEDGYLVYNACGFEASGGVRIGGRFYETPKTVPAAGWRVMSFSETKSRVRLFENGMENDFFRLEFDKSGRIVRMLDKRCGRSVFKDGAFGNELQLFEDIPRDFDAWEISDYYKQKQWSLDDTAGVKQIDDGDRRGLCFTHTYMNSVIVQTVYLYNKAERVDFETEIDWNEKHQLVKAAFPFSVCPEKAAYEIQYGYVERPTHSNTSWDAAKFEVCAHRYADVSEYDYGVSLINDCKYGHSCENGVLKLTLLKCAEYPDIMADRGHHSFKYALVPHSGDFRKAGVVEQAYLFNQPMCASAVSRGKGSLPESFSFASVDCDGVIIDTVKAAEDGEGTIIRMYESYGGSASGRLYIGVSIKNAFLCDLMENELEPLKIENSSVALSFSKFEIKTVKIM